MAPPKIPTRDLFDDTTMTFGEHLEVLRVHLIKALFGLVIGVLVSLTFSHHVIRRIQDPVTAAMRQVFGQDAKEQVSTESALTQMWRYLTGAKAPVKAEEDPATPPKPGVTPGGTMATVDPATIEPVKVTLDIVAIARELHRLDPSGYPAPPEELQERPVELMARIPELAAMHKQFRREMLEESIKARTDGPDEAFMIFLKVSLVTGLVISSPWVFYQLWLFVAAGLYPHERHYVYTYLPLSTGLFVGGALFAYFAVIPFVLNFLLSFNVMLDLRSELKIGTWINFAAILCLMFGLSFQLPIVMKFLEQISIFEAKDYREKRRIAILVMSVLSMLLTPSDPISMMLMLVPLVLLYEVGIWLCTGAPQAKSPFAVAKA